MHGGRVVGRLKGHSGGWRHIRVLGVGLRDGWRGQELRGLIPGVGVSYAIMSRMLMEFMSVDSTLMYFGISRDALMIAILALIPGVLGV